MSKYHNKKAECNNHHIHASVKEMRDCNILHVMQTYGSIKDLKVQPEFELQPGFKGVDGKKVRSIKYVADFSFYDNEAKKFRVIDTKGFSNGKYYRTELFRIKEKLFNYIMRDRGLMIEYEI